jgi:hypothetical protein
VTEPVIHLPYVAGARPRSSPHRPPRPASEPLSAAGRGTRTLGSRTTAGQDPTGIPRASTAIPGPRQAASAAAQHPAKRDRDGTTSFRCRGCGTAARFTHNDQRYGRLVHRFLDQHGQCGRAVEIAPGSSTSAVS